MTLVSNFTSARHYTGAQYSVLVLSNSSAVIERLGRR